MSAMVTRGLLAAAGAVALGNPASFREYRIEASHSEIGFAIEFLGHPVRGRFDDVRGTIVYAPEDLAASSVTVAIATNSINTGSKHRDEHLRSSDFFDTAKFPTILFTSRSVIHDGDRFIVTGPLTMHGVTRDVSIAFTKPERPVADPHGSSLVFFNGTLRLARRDFGIAGGSKYNDWFDELRQRALSDSVDVTLDVQGWDTDYERSPRWKNAVDRLLVTGVSNRVAALRALVAQHPDTLRDAEWELDQASRALLQRGKHKEALELFQLTAELFSKSSAAQASLARGYEAIGDTINARAMVQRALEIDSTDTGAIEVRRRLGGVATIRPPRR
jgi:polyisoprenoid-binding protein YceI